MTEPQTNVVHSKTRPDIKEKAVMLSQPSSYVVSDDSARAEIFNQHFFSVVTEDYSDFDDLKNSLHMLPFFYP